MDEVMWSRSVPVRYEADVAVIGGGIAGVAAACAAADSGARVALVERFGVAGGNMTSGGVDGFCGENSGQGEVFDEIVAGLKAFDAIAPYAPYGTSYDPDPPPGAQGARTFDHEILAVVLQELLLRRGVKLLLHTRFVDAIAQRGAIREAVVCGASGPEALRARQFIDCTGEGQVARMVGAVTMKGREQDGLQLPMSVMYFVREMDAPVCPQIPEGWFGVIRCKEDLPMTT